MKKLVKIIGMVMSLLCVGGVVAGYFDRKNNKKSDHKPYGVYEAFFKRPLDFILATAAAICLLPIMVVIALLVRIKLGSPILFSQERIGRDEKIFKLYKFRTMTDEKDAEGNLLPDEVRLTSFGKKLRSTSLDELPELFSIMKGDMAIIGPRPLLPKYIPYFTPEERIRHKVRGGLTVPEVLSGKIHTTWEEQFEYETNYARHITFFTDVKIFIATIKVLFKRVETRFGSDVRQSLDEERGGGKELCNQ
uniref:sugar transferase n=1 Tax=Agathobacter sp. TaxID=2021311 RepID=UPI004055E1F1